MLKRIISLALSLLIVATALGATACSCENKTIDPSITETGNKVASRSTKNEIDPKSIWSVTDGITLRLMQDSYPPGTSSMTMILENRSDSVMMYGEMLSFHEFKNGEWKELETIENYAFYLIAYNLSDHDRQTFQIGTWFLREPLSEGRYRVTGCSLTVYPDSESSWDNTNSTEYPPYQLEFTISESATAEPQAPPEEQLSLWRLPEIEDWQWYSAGACLEMYERAGMSAWQYVEGNNGLLAILYRPDTPENEYLNIGDLLLLDIIDRKTGKRYEVFKEPTVETEIVTAYQAGFKIDSGKNPLYCYIADNDTIKIKPL